MESLLQLFLLSLLGSIIALIGGVVFLFNSRLSKLLESYSIPFAAGVLVTVALLGLLPEALDHMGESALLIVLLSFFGAYLFEHLFFVLHHHSEDAHHHHSKNFKSSVPLVLIGDTIHNFIDGVAIGASFLLSPGLGFITAFSTFLHEVPHEIGDFGILLRAKWKRKDILIVNVISASLTIVGAFASLLFFENNRLIGAMLAVAAGVFLYLGAVDFLPQINEAGAKKPKSVVPLIIGVLAVALTLMLVPHSE